MIEVWVFSSSGSEKIYKCDLVLIAMGFLGPERSIVEQIDVMLDPRGNFKTPQNKYSTNLAKVYAAGGSFSLIYFLFQPVLHN